ncbi:hypothetical protein [Mangrovibacter yixingensis]|uniref:hypothetical protein n=1 Tax=Mangrovibacter yixingensis TaxID=1529639 RepID=UPI001CF9C980|nr:hypothetical protein [Mangrovibacter yixingensis]
MNRLSPLLASTLFFFSCHTALAASGFRDMDFGSSPDVIKEKAHCTLSGPVKVEIGEMYQCADFPFESGVTHAEFFFAGNQFIRLGIRVPVDNTAETINSLAKKYGLVSAPTEDEIATVRTTPGQSVMFTFDDGNIALYFASDSQGNTSTVLLLSSADAKALQDAHADDL